MLAVEIQSSWAKRLVIFALHLHAHVFTHMTDTLPSDEQATNLTEVNVRQKSISVEVKVKSHTKPGFYKVSRENSTLYIDVIYTELAVSGVVELTEDLKQATGNH